VGLYGNRILPWAIDRALSRPDIAALRARSVAAATGTVVELGFGSGLTLAQLPPQVTRVLAVEPSMTARRLAVPRIAEAAMPVEFVGLDGQALSLDDGSADTVVCGYTLCSIPDVVAAVREAHRVLRPGGAFLFLEHGLADAPKTRARQRAFTPLWRRVAGGCHLDRDPSAILRSGGFSVECERPEVKGPRLLVSTYLGAAVKPG
jgi:ubiquinone/menaquinone biosynthesis C-methylase UbiE